MLISILNILLLLKVSFSSVLKKSEILVDQLKYLSGQQMSVIEKIKSGKISISNISIVVANFEEDISWLNFYSNISIIYSKSRFNNRKFRNIIHLPNTGRESHTYLYHIVKNYHNLSDITVFTQGSAPTRGYVGHRQGGGHLLGNSSFHDFITSSSGHFVFTDWMWLRSAAHSIRKGYNYGDVPREDSLKKCPESPDINFESNLLPSRNHKFIIHHISKLCIRDNLTYCSPESFYYRFVKLPKPPNEVIFLAQGAIFSVTKEQIRRRAKSDYEELLYYASLGEDSAIGYFLEWFWYYILTSDFHPCTTNGQEFLWAIKQPIYETLGFPIWSKYLNNYDSTQKREKEKKNW